MTGIAGVLDTVLRDGAVRHEQIETVMIGTTQFTNAIIQRRELSEVAAIRMALPSGNGLPPMVDWPADIAEAMGGHSYMLRGGYLYDGRPLAELDDDAIDAVIADIIARKLKHIAIASAFSPMNAEPERYLAR